MAILNFVGLYTEWVAYDHSIMDCHVLPAKVMKLSGPSPGRIRIHAALTFDLTHGDDVEIARKWLDMFRTPESASAILNLPVVRVERPEAKRRVVGSHPPPPTPAKRFTEWIEALGESTTPAQAEAEFHIRFPDTASDFFNSTAWRIALEKFPDGAAIPCVDSCAYGADNVCDDGGSGASWTMCDYATDCSDCGQRYLHGARRQLSLPTCHHSDSNGHITIPDSVTSIPTVRAFASAPVTPLCACECCPQPLLPFVK